MRWCVPPTSSTAHTRPAPLADSGAGGLALGCRAETRFLAEAEEEADGGRAGPSRAGGANRARVKRERAAAGAAIEVDLTVRGSLPGGAESVER